MYSRRYLETRREPTAGEGTEAAACKQMVHLKSFLVIDLETFTFFNFVFQLHICNGRYEVMLTLRWWITS